MEKKKLLWRMSDLKVHVADSHSGEIDHCKSAQEAAYAGNRAGVRGGQLSLIEPNEKFVSNQRFESQCPNPLYGKHCQMVCIKISLFYDPFFHKTFP